MSLYRNRRAAALFAFNCLVACALLAAGAVGVQAVRAHTATLTATKAPLLLAPLVGVNDSCIEQSEGSPPSPASDKPEDLAASCSGAQGSAATLIESTLTQLAPAGAAASPYTLGYTLAVPLLTLFKRAPDGWEVDHERVAHVARTVALSGRPAVLYLFSTHFSVGSKLEEDLASNPANLAQTRDGPLPTGRYYGAPIYNWSVARTDNTLTARREQALAAVLDAVCTLPQPERARIRAVTVLGETHQLFPDFEAGMGYGGAYRITDYSPASVRGFQAYLRQQFGSVSQLNRTLGSRYAEFGDVAPPSRDIRTEALTRYTEHIDAFAQGSLPIAGWAFVAQPKRPGQARPAPWVHIYLDGVFIKKVRADRGRQDVAQALPEVRHADTGWRMDLDFRQVAPGLHRVDVLLEQRPGELTSIGSRQIAIMDARQQTPQPTPQKPLPTTAAKRSGVLGHIDQPLEQASYYFNPLVPYWHRFRGLQVADYLAHFSQQVARSCLADVPRYTHQIVPFSNPGWDENKFAIGRSLQPGTGLRLGVSLYGDAAYGARFPAWLRTTGQTTYGVTEFHPLRAMDAQQLSDVLASHAAHGAQFLSFFLEPRWQGTLVPRAVHNPFSFDPDNQQFGSDVLYRAMQQVLHPG